MYYKKYRLEKGPISEEQAKVNEMYKKQNDTINALLTNHNDRPKWLLEPPKFTVLPGKPEKIETDWKTSPVRERAIKAYENPEQTRSKKALQKEVKGNTTRQY